MIKRIVSWLIELFSKKPKEQNELEKIVKKHEERLKEIEDEKMDIESINNHFND